MLFNITIQTFTLYAYYFVQRSYQIITHANQIIISQHPRQTF